ncbi:hypothetical protein LINGRAHAP2_LOCUS9411 [Linum grandiflorum]
MAPLGSTRCCSSSSVLTQNGGSCISVLVVRALIVDVVASSCLLQLHLSFWKSCPITTPRCPTTLYSGGVVVLGFVQQSPPYKTNSRRSKGYYGFDKASEE